MSPLVGRGGHCGRAPSITIWRTRGLASRMSSACSPVNIASTFGSPPRTTVSTCRPSGLLGDVPDGVVQHRVFDREARGRAV